ncbi:MAG: hypothetical protein JXM72_10505 [Deltaproteobacteria bacterium]|nr:hypothetical protein [Deltaproteobacteria bacterium]
MYNRFISLSIYITALAIFITVFMVGCSGGGSSDSFPLQALQGEEVVVPDTTKVLDNSTMQHISYSSEDLSEIRFNTSTTDLEQLEEDDVIVCGVTAATPYGMLRKVESIARNGDETTVLTTQATLEDAIESGDIEASFTLSSSEVVSSQVLASGASLSTDFTGELVNELIDVVIYDFDGDSETTNDQVKATGSIALDHTITFTTRIRNFRLQELSFTNTLHERVDIDLAAQFSASLGGEMQPLVRYYLSPVTIQLGPVPVVLTPILTVNIGASGQVRIGVTAGVMQDAELTAGLEYINGEWSPVSDPSNDFDYDPPTPVCGVNVKAFAGPQVDLLLYGVVGPYGTINGYLDFSADAFSDPWWELYGGFSADLGVRFGCLSNVLFDYSENVLDYRILLANADDAPPVGYGELSGSVRNAGNGSALEEVSIEVYLDEDLDGYLESTELVVQGFSNSAGIYSFSVEAGSGYTVLFAKNGYLPAIYNDVEIQVDVALTLEPVLQIDENYSGLGNVSGTILSALDGYGVSGLNIGVREGINTTSGDIIASAVTQSGGAYVLYDLYAGNYTAEVIGSGYNTTYFSIYCIGGTTTPGQNAAVTPILSDDETRIVLTWGSTPSDLDSHLTGPLSDGSRFHMYYPYKGSSSPWPEYVMLDLDDVTSYGPETTTIYQQIDGVYRFSVHDYSNRGSSSSTYLSNSGCQVRVYRGSDLVATFNVPPNQGGTLWTVFEMDQYSITPVNSLSFVTTPSQVLSSAVSCTAQPTDAALLRNLPEKY